MQNFIVLGIVPGTNIQLGFSFWLLVAMSFSGLICLPKIIRFMYAMRRQLIARQIAHRISQLELISL